MNKIIAYLISGITLVLGTVVLCFLGNPNGSEGVLFILGPLGMPLTLLGGMGSPFIAAFLYFVQYQVVAFLVYKWVRSSFVSCFILVILLGYFSLILVPVFKALNDHEYLNKVDQMIPKYNKALELNPNDENIYYKRAFAYDSKGNYKQAIFDFNKSIELDPNTAVKYYMRGYEYYKIGEYDKAWSDVNKAQTLGFKVDPNFVDDLKRHLGK